MDNMRHVARNSRGSDAMNVRIKDYDRKVDVLTRELNATRNQTNRSDLMAGATGRKFGDIEVHCNYLSFCLLWYRMMGNFFYLFFDMSHLSS